MLCDGSSHELLHTERTPSGRIEWFPAHPHEGLVTPDGPHASVVARGCSRATGRLFNLAVALDGEVAPDGRPMGRAVAESTFHHFADYNWDIGCGAPSFVSELPGTEIRADGSRLTAFKDYVRNLAAWLQPQASWLDRQASIGSMLDRGTSTCNGPAESGSNTPSSKKKITPSLTTAKFW